MKKIFFMVLCICACMAITACGNKGGEENFEPETSQSKNSGIELPEEKF